MVGAIADWFAVTALFRHPLGLPVPHTALIPQAQGRAGPGPRGVRRRELPPGDDHPRPGRRRRTSRRRLGRVARPSPHTHAGWSTRSRDVAAHRRCGKVRDDARRPTSSRGRCSRGSVEEPIAPLAGSLLEEVVRDDLHHGLVDLALDELHGWLVENPGHVRRGARRAGALVGAAAAQRRGDPPGPPRGCWPGSPTSATTRGTTAARRSTRCSTSSATTCCTTPTTQARAEALKDRLLDHPQVARHGDLALERRCAARS